VRVGNAAAGQTQQDLNGYVLDAAWRCQVGMRAPQEHLAPLLRNEFARKGEDPDFGKGSRPWAVRLTGDPSYPNPCVGPLDKAPYFGVRLVPVGVGINSHGLETNEFAQVMHLRGHPIAGLYAVGNSAALRDLGAGYQSGTSNMRAITWGWIAGRHVAGKA
jgi:hypothetical protein